MSLQDYAVKRDRFELHVNKFGVARWDAELAWPCCCCMNSANDDMAEPCRSCDHNVNAIPDSTPHAMTFAEARQALTELVGEDCYRAMYYELCENGNGTASQLCRVYAANGKTGHSRTTWDKTLADLRVQVAPEPIPPVELTPPTEQIKVTE